MIAHFGGIFFEGDENLANRGSLEYVLAEIHGALYGQEPKSAWSIMLARDIQTCAKTPRTGSPWLIRYRDRPPYACDRALSYVVFLCHLALEKLLKAHVAEFIQTVPIKNHDLIYLVKKSELQLPENHLDFIGKINPAAKRIACAVMSYQAGVSYESLWAQYAAQEEEPGTFWLSVAKQIREHLPRKPK